MEGRRGMRRRFRVKGERVGTGRERRKEEAEENGKEGRKG